MAASIQKFEIQWDKQVGKSLQVGNTKGHNSTILRQSLTSRHEIAR